MKLTTNFPPLPWEGKGEATSAATNARRPASVTFGQKFSRPLSKSELQSLLLSDSQVASARKIDLIVLHCSDTRPSQNFTIEKLAASHKARGFGEYPGYHFYIRRDGTLYYCRPLYLKGCHVSGYNAHSIGICTEGGHREGPEQIPVGNLNDLTKLQEGRNPPPLGGEKRGAYEDNRTAEQKVVVHDLLLSLHEMFPEARICGHRDLPGVAKACPCYDAAKEYAYILK